MIGLELRQVRQGQDGKERGEAAEAMDDVELASVTEEPTPDLIELGGAWDHAFMRRRAVRHELASDLAFRMCYENDVVTGSIQAFDEQSDDALDTPIDLGWDRNVRVGCDGYAHRALGKMLVEEAEESAALVVVLPMPAALCPVPGILLRG